ncbi:YmfQ family protein [Rhodopila sp.]|uniref:YmfQ family protein n=1 Tax=Rhodopila sp. TaxID=2480087 RepID=UPI003D0E844F
MTNPPSAAFLAAVQALPPPGRAFPSDPTTIQAQVFTPPADALLNVRAIALQLANVEADPAFTTELLPDWEADFGLPDPCSAPGASVEQRRASLLARIASLGGQSPGYYIAVAAALGFTISITEFIPFRLGVAQLGQPLLSPGWQFVWQVNAPAITVSYFKLGQSVWGDPFWSVGNTELQCRIRALAPAHTLVLFKYS